MTTFDDWVGKTEVLEEPIDHARVSALAATLDSVQPTALGEPLPPGWHWLFFSPMVRRSQLGPDGHPARGGFLPPIDLPRRMWAGSRITYLADLPIGAVAQRRSSITKIGRKAGQSGELWFVTVTHLISAEGRDCVAEEQDIVYREAPPVGVPPPLASSVEPPDDAEWCDEWTPDTVLLFRYSALTSNGHRIHYDQPYARSVEGYADLVVHGPLAATILQGSVLEHLPGCRLRAFTFRGTAPICLGNSFFVEGKHVDRDVVAASVRLATGGLAMRATAKVVSRVRE